jgi:hypothetical protein
MSLAVCILIRSLDPGKTEEFIQFSTARGLRSVYSNIYHAAASNRVCGHGSEHYSDMGHYVPIIRVLV